MNDLLPYLPIAGIAGGTFYLVWRYANAKECPLTVKAESEPEYGLPKVWKPDFNLLSETKELRLLGLGKGTNVRLSEGEINLLSQSICSQLASQGVEVREVKVEGRFTFGDDFYHPTCPAVAPVPIPPDSSLEDIEWDSLIFTLSEVSKVQEFDLPDWTKHSRRLISAIPAEYSDYPESLGYRTPQIKEWMTAPVEDHGKVRQEVLAAEGWKDMTDDEFKALQTKLTEN